MSFSFLPLLQNTAQSLFALFAWIRWRLYTLGLPKAWASGEGCVCYMCCKVVELILLWMRKGRVKYLPALVSYILSVKKHDAVLELTALALCILGCFLFKHC